MGKARVAPIKQVSIPRLELQAASASVTTGHMLKKQLRYDYLQETYWCDSTVTLGYINNDAKRFHTFVANRVQQIRDKSEPNQWRHVRSESNPADYASRGLSVDCLLKKSFWFTGPDFLWLSELPGEAHVDYENNISTDDPDVRKQTCSTHLTEVDERVFDLERFSYFSDWTRLKRAVALCLKYKTILKDRVKGSKSLTQKDGISVEDLRGAEMEIIKMIQQQTFKEELSILKDDASQAKERRLKRRHVLFKLDPFIDDEGILRIGGRLSAASLSFETKHPIVLPKDSHVSHVIARHCHVKAGHQGRGITMNCIRSSGYWLIGCRNIVSSLLHKCVLCKRLRGAVAEQQMADLPRDRVEQSPPFTYCAVDYFGPFYVQERRSTLKRYGVLFTCMASRAVHIETANSMSTDAFINALRRFVAVRGPIRQLRSDMGSNFVGAERELHRELKDLDQDKIKQHLLQNNCDYFQFAMNVPNASHMGGVWERQIRTVRNALSSLLQSSGQQLDDESLRTLLLEAMAIVNGRPLTVRDLSDSGSPEPLTPNHLLHMKTQVILPPPGEFQREDLYLHKRWRRVQHLLNIFWKRWKDEYLQTLQVRSKWCGKKSDLVKGDVVIIKDDNLPRNKWLLARVEETMISKDNKVRKVKLQVATAQLNNEGERKESSTFLERPIHKLVFLLRPEVSPVKEPFSETNNSV